MLLQKTLEETFGGSEIQHKPSFILQPVVIVVVENVSWCFSPVADLLIGDPVENLEWIKHTSKMKYEARRFTMRGKSVFFSRTSYAATNGCRWSPDAKHGSVLLKKWSLVIANALYAPASSETRD